MFNRKVICSKCNKRHKRKKARDRPIYVCSSYDNYGSGYCSRNKVDEAYIIQLIRMRFRDKPIEEIIPMIDSIEVDDYKVKINLIQGDPIMEDANYAQF